MGKFKAAEKAFHLAQNLNKKEKCATLSRGSSVTLRRSKW